MNLVVVSQCAKNALTETRRILDQFAERSGHRTWIFESTDEGQKQIRRMLKRTARKNTAVICYHIKKAGGKEILWLVGNPRRFNEGGAVPTNTTGRDMLGGHLENSWHHLQAIKTFSALAGLFHDVGKANKLFQNKLNHASKTQEPVRHEWVSLRVFEAFVNGDEDHFWLKRLSQIKPANEKAVLARLFKDGSNKTGKPNADWPLTNNPFKRKLSAPIAQLIGWLIVSHHRLPELEDSAPLNLVESWFTDLDLLFGNSPQAKPPSKGKDSDHGKPNWSASDWKNVFHFNKGTPLRSKTWCAKARKFAGRALTLTNGTNDKWMENPFVMHLCRLSLMLSDHVYSGQLPVKAWQDKESDIWANTFMVDYEDEENGHHFAKGEKKQKLDEHNIGVAQQSFHFPNLLPNLRRDLPSFSQCKALKALARDGHFNWQNKATQLALSIKERSKTQGLIGFNIASTGRGKTLGNAKIMYALSDEQQGCRFSVALGLRTLTLQTGDAFKAKLALNEEDIAVMIGSQAVLNLHHLNAKADINSEEEYAGSESLAPLFTEHQTVHYEGSTEDSRLKRWLTGSDKARKMLNAPILVSTIDHLIPATDGCRGGRQIAPMLRLLSADLVLDEPDDFGLEDLPALCRLVNQAGMLGSRVLLSSATIPPDLAQALFEAYHEGRKHYRKNCLDTDTDATTLCAWFDEKDSISEEILGPEQFEQSHQQFIARRIEHLKQCTPLQCGQIIDIVRREKDVGRENNNALKPDEAVKCIAETILHHIPGLHQHHNQQHPQTRQRFSLGVVRMANINPLVAVAKTILAGNAPTNYRYHIVVYHSRFPLIIRSNLEKELDALFYREKPETLWQHQLIESVVLKYQEPNQVVLVLSSPVSEVGRNWDADYAIYEPSSFRSIIQGAGRVNRHRRKPVEHPNMLLLNQNHASLIGKQVAFTRPGFENRCPFHLKAPKDLQSKTDKNQIEVISAIPRITRNKQLNFQGSLVDLEHAHTRAKLFGLKKNIDNNPFRYFSAMWWNTPMHWSQQHQKQLGFRKSKQQQDYFFYLEDEQEELQFFTRNPQGKVRSAGDEQLQSYAGMELPMGQGISWLLRQDLKAALLSLAEQQEMDIGRCSEIYSEVKLDEDTHWSYHPDLGIYGEP